MMANPSRITGKFNELASRGAKAFIPYIMAGSPSLERTEELVGILEKNGADIIELGVPFSDPLADGPVIQRAAERALSNRVTLRGVVALVKKLRQTTNIPLILMTYYNPVFKYGIEGFCRDASEAGVDGLIVPDLPPEEAGELLASTGQHGMDVIFLVAPTSTKDRIKKVAKSSKGFIYYVSMTGITGAKLKTDADIKNSIALVKKSSGGMPVAVGFGVSTPEEAKTTSAMADGVIIGSAIVRKTEDPDFVDYLGRLRGAIR